MTRLNEESDMDESDDEMNEMRRRRKDEDEEMRMTRWEDADDDWKLRNGVSHIVQDVIKKDAHTDVIVAAEDLPSYSALIKEVKPILARCDWWERHGYECLQVLATIPMFLCGLLMIRMGGCLVPPFGVFLMGICHAVWAYRVGHAAVHGNMCQSAIVNRGLVYLFLETLQGYSYDLMKDIHITLHHPYTNIIGLGDSAVWRAPYLPGFIYLFIAPFFVPVLSPVIAIATLITRKMWLPISRLILCYSLGTFFIFWLLLNVAALSFNAAVFIFIAYRGVFGAPLVHVNVLHHIGLPMWDVHHRPSGVYQVAATSLNMRDNRLMNFCFGYAVFSCHIEHHLFPRLSNSMCLKIRPVVRRRLLEAGLPYTETTYTQRLLTFYRNYTELMVNATPVTHLVMA